MKAADEIIVSLEKEPGRWDQTEYTLRRNDGIELWTNVGEIEIYEPWKLSIPIMDRLRLCRAIRKWKNNISLNDMLAGANRSWTP